MISLRKDIFRRRFLNPLRDFQEEDQEVEIRFDPLLDHWAVFNPVLEDKVKLFFGTHDWSLVEELAEATQASCFMCPPKVREVTPRYPDSLIPGGRLEQGECTLFPNLFPVALYHAVIAVGEAHFRRLKDFSPGLIQDGLALGLRFLKLLEKDAQALSGAICANYLPPAGASLVHPHFQVVAGPYPSPQMKRLYQASFNFYQTHGQNFWANLVEKERELGERFIASLGRVNFLTSFAPWGTNEVLAVIPEIHTLEEIAPEDIDHLAQGLSAILKGYEEMGYGSFNFTLFLPPLKEKTPWFSPLLRVITRQNLYENYRTDDYFLQRQLGAELILTPPEKLAQALKQHFEEVK